ncbi:hypothetical protein CTEN210_03006 [Chaetoceros tenuissimus]|uniref:Leucine-rich repeat domain-containing protein n=1 Tax=Chaetoceros tenuissimus TaxID=426638 RepID=A0AAD3H0V9_9STRA|nr:hypothetical protein CTEN210_03006 [Chaetoceros tenuissimus]
MRVATVDGLVTLFYDGSERLRNEELHEEWIIAYNDYDQNDENWEDWPLSDECKDYWRQRQSWQQIIVEDGTTTIERETFYRCYNIKRVVFADTVIRIEDGAFSLCRSLNSIELPINLEFIEQYAFCHCDLVSVFVPPRCREIGNAAFHSNQNLTIFNIPPQTEIGYRPVIHTKLFRESSFYKQAIDNDDDIYDNDLDVNILNWIKNVNNDEKYTLHRACSSFQPLDEIIHNIIETRGIGAFAKKNEMGITPSQYLQENPYTDVKEMDVIRGYVMKMMG